MSNLVPAKAQLPATLAATAATSTAAKGGLWGAAKGLFSAGLKAFSNLHPAAKVAVVAGTALVASKALSSSKEPAAQRVA